MTPTEIREAVARLVEAGAKATPGEWAWSNVSDKGNGYIVGAGCSADGTPLSGRIEHDEMGDEFLCHHIVGEHEASTCNYGDPDFIVTAANFRPALAALAGMCVLDVETVRVLVKAAQQWRDEMVVMDDEPEHVAITAALAAAEAEVARVEGR